ncbi:MAG: hypothetical protein F9K09_01440 [Flavobacteriales bacterium]|nr:MAG: hypothetical protein F9K09_01440 [Flavobacteriales bacterium]
MFFYGIKKTKYKQSRISGIHQRATKTNPIFYVDKDGEKILIHYQDKDGNNKSYEYGSKQQVPDDEFVQNTILAIEHLRKSDIGSGIVDLIASSTTKNLNIIKTNSVENFHFKPVIKDLNGNMIPKGNSVDDANNVMINEGTIKFNPNKSIEFNTANGTKSISPATALSHELGHAFSAFFATFSFVTGLNTPDATFVNQQERFTTEQIENKIAEFFMEGIRTDRSGSEIETIGPTTNQKVVTSDSQLNQGTPVELEN